MTGLAGIPDLLVCEKQMARAGGVLLILVAVAQVMRPWLLDSALSLHFTAVVFYGLCYDYYILSTRLYYAVHFKGPFRWSSRPVMVTLLLGSPQPRLCFIQLVLQPLL